MQKPQLVIIIIFRSRRLTPPSLKFLQNGDKQILFVVIHFVNVIPNDTEIVIDDRHEHIDADENNEENE